MSQRVSETYLDEMVFMLFFVTDHTSYIFAIYTGFESFYPPHDLITVASFQRSGHMTRAVLAAP